MSEQIQVVVERRWDEAPNIAAFQLARVDGAPLPAWTAGAHVDVHVPTEAGVLVRQYSLCGPADGASYRIAVLREADGRGGSAGMHALTEGTRLAIGAPRNTFVLDETAARTLLFAGGIGITPLLAMAERLHQLERPFTLHYSTRSRSQTAFVDALEQGPWSADVRLYHDDGQAFVAVQQVLATDPHAHLYVCGPPGYIAHVLDEARAAGVPEERLHVEYFGAPPSEPSDGPGFTVKLARQGIEVRVGPEQTIAEALEDAGFPVQLSCEQGICGTCLTRVLEGVPDHQDMYQTAAEHEANTQITVCCSRSKTPVLVLDL